MAGGAVCGEFGVKRIAGRGRECAEFPLVFLDGGGQSLDIAFRCRARALLLDSAHGGQDQARKDADHGYDNKQFDERECGCARCRGRRGSAESVFSGGGEMLMVRDARHVFTL